MPFQKLALNDYWMHHEISRTKQVVFYTGRIKIDFDSRSDARNAAFWTRQRQTGNVEKEAIKP